MSAEGARRPERDTAGAPAPETRQLELALDYCPVCSARLESRRCKMRCPRCHYYMSCSDYV